MSETQSEKNTTGELDPSIWDEAVAVTGRPQDEPLPNSTFAERAKAASKAVKSDDAEDKAVTRATKKRK